tara:strand:- start:749 stop:2668 length:1920 start_codon:yes stop_codon:yes gene_type:complete
VSSSDEAEASVIESDAAPQIFPPGGSRLVVYVVYDRRGQIDPYIPFALRAFRAHAERLLVVVNGALDDDGRKALESVADVVLQRENTGFDTGGFQAAVAHEGARLAEFDEVLFTNDTWFGPVRPLAPIFERMDAEAVDLWGLTDHPRVEQEASWTGEVIPYHLQSYWIAVRGRMLRSAAWDAYWRALPEITSWREAVMRHEVVFTDHFVQRGYRSAVVFPFGDYDTENPSVFSAREMLAQGCPTLKRKALYFWPPSMDHYAAIGRWTLEAAESYGYPRELMLPHLAKNAPPRDLTTVAGLIDVFGDDPSTYDASKPLRVVVVAHIYYVDMVEDMLARADLLPGPYHLLVTTSDTERARAIEAILTATPRTGRTWEVRVVGSNDGRDQSAFLIACRDVLLSSDYDVIVKIHSKRTPQQGYAVGAHFRRQQFDNLLPSGDYIANVLALFQREPGLGLAYPPMIHIGHGTLGHAWWGNRPRFEEVARMLGVSVPIDPVSPLAPFGSMYVARPEALRLLAEHEWAYSDFGGADAYKDGGLAHVLERMPSYVAGELGYHTRVILWGDYATWSHTSLEFKYTEMSATLDGAPRERIALTHRLGWTGVGRFRDFVRMYLRYSRPTLADRVSRIAARVRHPFRRTAS